MIPETQSPDTQHAEENELMGCEGLQMQSLMIKNMGPIDPHGLLQGLSALVGKDGSILNEEAVQRMVNLMKDASKMVSRCTYLNILRATNEQEILEKFISEGGWDLLNTWLQDAKADSSSASFLMEILKVYQQMPVSVELLKKNNCAKTIKNLSKEEDGIVKTLATEIVDNWMKKIKEKSGTEASTDKSKKKKKHKDKEKSKEKEKTKDEKSNGQDSKSDSKKERRDSLNSSANKSKDLSNSLNSSQNKSSSQQKERAKTVKSLPSKFRSTGLEEQTTLVQKKKGSINKDKPPVKRPLPTPFNRPLTAPPEKKPRPVLPSPIMPSTSANGASPTATSPPTETHGKIKIIPAKPRPVQHEVHESRGFMDALTAPAIVPVRRKKKLPPKPTTPTSPNMPKPQLSFYKDTLDTSNENKEEKRASSPPGTDKKQSEGSESNDVEMKDDNSNSAGSSQSSGDNEKSTEASSGKKKKKVSWVDDANLRQIHYFEMDETERVNVNRLNFEEMKKKEMMEDRHIVEVAKKKAQDKMNEKTNWHRPHRIDGLTQLPTAPGERSTERETQAQREKAVLQAIFFSKDMLPDTAQEPDPENYTPSEPKIIPLEDEASADHEMEPAVEEDQAAAPHVEGEEQPQLSLPPDIAEMIQNLARQQQPQDQQDDHSKQGDQQQQPHQPPSSPPAPISPGDIQNIKNILSSLSGGGDQQQIESLRRALEPFKNQLPPNFMMTQFGIPLHLPGLLGSAPPGFRPMMPPRGPGRGPVPMMRGRMPTGFPFRPRGPPPPPMMRGRGIGRGDRPVCRHFMAAGRGCRFAMSCQFLHPGVNGPPLPPPGGAQSPTPQQSPPHQSPTQ
ncbi:serine/threonine-protein phosphatase 1 regulatory subunit 10 [Lingula anatina]|uniref:Serine/threonine-protein phosphatase 1 regulatory subunit 10 n=1 Tax=Lingula anatina TaxID=7574 RepID=A0A1S3IPZ4_LINAN|nr:serine/threonine-protein phosphatase 1 regulatory subunit 10 [Lingula anatina]XP_013400138.1 serine/threonine-protein phosphatase 1 regulatory subunit 10 [Lingula anatina]|eukprot:XP_013400137.1 serine/threonine-protein phosphatase 1 regulatory subunit 10 [Lingula anatina]